MVYYKLVKITINAANLAKVIINTVLRHYGLPNSIVNHQKAVFILKFWSLFCYSLGIKRRLSTVFQLQTKSQTKQRNSIIEADFRAFINFEQDH